MTGEQQKLVQESEQRFRALADSALAQNGDALRRQNVDTLAEALKPMRENFELFRRTFAERLALDRRVRELADLNAVIGRETRRLTDALKGNAKVQGDWGEMILENILERCGLRRGQEYVVQAGVCTDSGRQDNRRLQSEHPALPGHARRSRRKRPPHIRPRACGIGAQAHSRTAR